MKASVQFDHSPQSEACIVSKDVFRESWSSEPRRFAEITLPSYNPFDIKPIVAHVQVDENLPSRTARLSAKLFDVPEYGPAFSFCYLQMMDKSPQVFETVAISVSEQLYDKLMRLRLSEHKLEYLKIKFGLRSLETVVWKDFSIYPSLCSISYCAPHFVGLINFQRTQIIFVKSMNLTVSEFSMNSYQFDLLRITPSRNLRMRLKCLEFSVPPDLITPVPSKTDDDTIYAFANFETMLHMGIASGSYVRLASETVSRIVKLFVFANPNSFDSFKIFVHPRIAAHFSKDEEVYVTKCAISETEIQIPSSVSISRVGCWDNSQKILQNIIFSNLKLFLTSKKRVLHGGDMIPIPFDSNMAALCSDDSKGGLPFAKNDRVVWFYVENFEMDSKLNSKSSPEFIIDPNKTKLITANTVSRPPLTIDRCNYISYYGLKKTFDYDFSIFPYAKKMCDVLSSFLSCRDRKIPFSSSILLHSASPNTGKSMLVEFAAGLLGFHLFKIDCTLLTTTVGSIDSTAKIMGYLRGKLDGSVLHSKPAIIFISHLDVIVGKSEQGQDFESGKVTKTMDAELTRLIQAYSSTESETVFIGSVNDIDTMPQNIRNTVKFDINIPIPSENQRLAIFEWLLSPYQLNQQQSSSGQLFHCGRDVSTSKLALQCAGLTPLDIEKIVQSAKYNCFKRSSGYGSRQICVEGLFYVTMEDLSKAITKARDEFSLSIGAPKIPRVTWKDIGGMDTVQGEIMDTIEMPLKHPELFASGMKKRSGILFYGPPGTGKTLMAKAIATNFSLNFFSVKGPELLNMYIGESEANVRRVFQKARDAKPCVIFFDELDSVAPKRGNQGDSGGVMDRIVSQLLAELDSMGTEGDGVFVIGATNRPDLLDDALLRPGRFDKLLYLGISDTDDKQLNILRALTRKFSLADDVNLANVVKKCPFTYTGADFYALCSDAMLNAMSRIAEEVDGKVNEYNKQHNVSLSVRYWFDRIAKEDDMKVTVRMTDFLKAQRELTPSVSEDELSHYLRVKANFEGS